MIRKRFLRKAVILMAVAMMTLTGCKKEANNEITEQPTTTESQNETTTKAEETTSTQEETTEKESKIEKPDTEPVDNGFPTLESDTSLIPKGETVRSFLTGEWMNDTVAYRRPLAVMINNIEGALPQRGISEADIIYEGQCEGNVTRLMAVFQDYDNVDTLGSIRSCRDYFPWLAAECDAAYFHFGQSDFALEFLDDPLLMTFNGMTGEYNFDRRSDRVSPHNVFTSPENLVTAMVNGGVSTYLDEGATSVFPFTESDERIECTGDDAQECYTLNTGYGYNNASFVFNEEDGLYFRYEYGQPQVDEKTGEQIAVDNVLLKLVPGDRYWNDSPLYILTGEGLGLLVTNGTASWVRWSKEAQGLNTNLGCNYYYGYDATTYSYFDGRPVEFNQGTTWVCIVEQQNQANIEIIGK